jgi:hypothetical protein
VRLPLASEVQRAGAAHHGQARLRRSPRRAAAEAAREAASAALSPRHAGVGTHRARPAASPSSLRRPIAQRDQAREDTLARRCRRSARAPAGGRQGARRRIKPRRRQRGPTRPGGGRGRTRGVATPKSRSPRHSPAPPPNRPSARCRCGAGCSPPAQRRAPTSSARRGRACQRWAKRLRWREAGRRAAQARERSRQGAADMRIAAAEAGAHRCCGARCRRKRAARTPRQPGRARKRGARAHAALQARAGERVIASSRSTRAMSALWRRRSATISMRRSADGARGWAGRSRRRQDPACPPGSMRSPPCAAPARLPAASRRSAWRIAMTGSACRRAAAGDARRRIRRWDGFVVAGSGARPPSGCCASTGWPIDKACCPRTRGGRHGSDAALAAGAARSRRPRAARSRGARRLAAGEQAVRTAERALGGQAQRQIERVGERRADLDRRAAEIEADLTVTRKEASEAARLPAPRCPTGNAANTDVTLRNCRERGMPRRSVARPGGSAMTLAPSIAMTRSACRPSRPKPKGWRARAGDATRGGSPK